MLLDIEETETSLRQASLEQFRYLFFGTTVFWQTNCRGCQSPDTDRVENKPPDNGFLTFSKGGPLAPCMTGAGYAMQGEGILNWAFQQAGARSVMVALWNIPVEES